MRNWLFFFWLCTHPLYASFVSCKLTDQLGNQMFQVAATLSLAWDNQADAYFPDLNKSDFQLSTNRDRIFFRLDSSSPPGPFANYYQEKNARSAEKIPYRPDQLLTGWFISWKHFHHHRGRLLNIFAPSDADLHYLQTKYGHLLADPDTVAVHVRTFNKPLHDLKVFPFLGLQYYREAMDQFPPNSTFVIFSDRINWCKVHFPKLGKQCVFIEGNDAVQDLFLLSMMRHNIISNSTFSWWGAYLNQNPDKRVVAPRYWMHPRCDRLYFGPYIQNCYLPEWTLVTPTFKEPYPVDMTWYGSSTSLDGDSRDWRQP